MTSNKDMPAMPQSVAINDMGETETSDRAGGMGLTKLEQFCLTIGVADTGDEKLDAIIRKGNEKKLAGLAMQGFLAADGRADCFYKSMDDVAKSAIQAAKALLAQLEEEK